MTFPVAYFGSIAYFRELVKYSSVQLEAKEHFPKQTYRNRCDILGANGIISLTIPVRKVNGTKTILDQIEIVDDGWRDIHWKSIRSAYESAPYFDYYQSEIKELIYQDEKNLLRFDRKILERMIDWLVLPVEISLTDAFIPYSENDPRIDLVGKNQFQNTAASPYIQVFPGKQSFRNSLSLMDAILCEGPMARKLLIL